MADDWGSMDPQLYCRLLELPISPKAILRLGDRLVEDKDENIIRRLLGEEDIQVEKK